MVPIQEVDIHTDKNVFYKLHIVSPTGAAPFFIEVLVYDSEFNPPFASKVNFHQQFQDANAAFMHGFSWVSGYSKKHGYTVNRINNPYNCEFLSQTDQQKSVQNAGFTIQVQVNGA
jgi:hypothetical protein